MGHRVWVEVARKQKQRDREREREIKVWQTHILKNNSFIKGTFSALTKGITMKPEPCIALDPTANLRVTGLRRGQEQLEADGLPPSPAKPEDAAHTTHYWGS